MKRVYADLGLLAVAIIWGLTFPVVKVALNFVSPFAFNSIRFLLTSILFIPFLKREEMRAGLAIGGATFLGYAFQTVGLQYTTSTNAGFITSTYVVFTPMIAFLLYRERIQKIDALSVLLTVAGIYLLSGFEGVKAGDGLMILCAVAFAFEIVLISRYAGSLSIMSLAGWQVFAVGLLSSVPAALTTERLEINSYVIFALALTGFLATFLAKIVQNRMQAHTDSVDAGIILSMEGVFAHIFGVLFMNESLTSVQYSGVLLLMMALILITGIKNHIRNSDQ